MPLGQFTLTIGGERQDGTAETKAKLHLRTQGVDTLIDADADEFKFPTQFADGRGVNVSLPYSIDLFTDTASGEGVSTTIGYEGWIRTDTGRVDFQIAAQEAGSTVSLTDLVDTVVVPVSTALQYVTDAEAAAAEAAASQAAVEALTGTFAAYVRHGDDPTTPRPAGAIMVIWVGEERPDNMDLNDLWIEDLGIPDVLDTFDRANASTLGTADSGHVWDSGGFWTISSNRATATGTGVAFLEANRSDGQITMKILGHGTGTVGVVFRYADSQNYFGVTNARVFKRVANVVTNLADFNGGVTFVTGDTCRIVLAGSAITVYRDAGSTGTFTQIASYTDTSHQTATKHGLRSAGTGGQVDNYEIVVA